MNGHNKQPFLGQRACIMAHRQRPRLIGLVDKLRRESPISASPDKVHYVSIERNRHSRTLVTITEIVSSAQLWGMYMRPRTRHGSTVYRLVRCRMTSERDCENACRSLSTVDRSDWVSVWSLSPVLMGICHQ